MIEQIAQAGTITSLNITLNYVVTPEQCLDLGRDCIVNVLCKASICIEEKGMILLKWIW